MEFVDAVDSTSQTVWNKFSNILDHNPTYDIICLRDDKKLHKNPFYKFCYEILETVGDTFAISISGGVDSMLLSYFASIYAKKHQKSMKLIHINYGNRDTCDEEVEFLKEWSNKIDADLNVKQMTIVRNRNSKERKYYEETTKNIRFDTYRQLQCPILLGHNKDDCYENVFTNLSKKIHFENLFGMSEISTENGVTIIRPFLEISKIDIINQAHDIGIPYLEDSTPAWSQRGKMRDSLIPQIQEFNGNILSGLNEFIKHSKFLEEQWEINFKSWRETVIENKEDRTVTIDQENNFYKINVEQINFWVKLWFTLGENSRPSNKCFQQLINKIKCSNIDTDQYTFVLNKENTVKYTKNLLIIYLNKV